MSLSSFRETIQALIQSTRFNTSIFDQYIPILVENYASALNIFVIAAFIILCIFFLKDKPNSKYNWAIFYSTLYMTVMLFSVNYFCAKLELWSFNYQGNQSSTIPPDLFFIWIVIWGILPFAFFRGRHLVLVSAFLLWIDICTMPILDAISVIKLNPRWILGDISLILTIFVPGYFWAYCSYHNNCLGVRAMLQVITFGIGSIIGIPLLLNIYGRLPNLSFDWSSIEIQLFFIAIFPGLAAVNDLVTKGKGTAFPFDPTKFLVRTGVYAYCKNPIQWSYALSFILLSVYHSSFYFLVGFLVTILFTIGISDPHESKDMTIRFGKDWGIYKLVVPKWMFLWTPNHIPKGVVFFKADCNQCKQIRTWFLKSKPINLDLKFDTDYPGNKLTQVTYIDHNGMEFKSVTAIACCLEHINLAYASLGWFMRFPVINYLLQLIVDSMEFESVKKRL
ncbi:hypothetical protein HOG98_10090 [bacterium]|jgi:protein-S-isoprenylcysteine O-methyltransferase Ste14|nr:hypothetical protein [bacterium]